MEKKSQFKLLANLNDVDPIIYRKKFNLIDSLLQNAKLGKSVKVFSS